MSSYYKNDVVQNCAIGGLCDALWDIKGRQAGMPVYQLVGGKCREAIRIANDTHYGLAAAVWTRDIYKAFRVVKALRAGIV